ncbi:LytTR family two component transcriptional regulator [Ruminiclostridium sufflavum DSM 19573]|uniref:Stage 0 sporulation protein A homolog n=1 Tax=Ruminiclostridium sufflavum DSM 19573 TaxID=1121337 RepID=A0A318XJV6_9FIRM|nr:LytTR family DNA-binding domain-containing protein [Ruminiclostridium sufflavum]PYG86623.1 LytTR family two component transcriptional regulator [Ruminiclostridium sufflavum DSM 19573]
MIRISVCDDDISMTENLKKGINDLRCDLEILTFDCGNALLLSEFLYNDIIILDIEMNDINGIQAAKQLRENGYYGIIIFLTSYKEMVFDSLKVKPYEYIVKPVEITKLKLILGEAVNYVLERRNTHFEAVCNSFTFRIKVCDIYFFESRGRKIDINTKDGIKTIIGKINQIEASLSNRNFFRCHKSYLINLEHVYMFSNSEITLDNNQKVLISRLRLNSFKEAFRAFMKGNRKCQ